MQKQNFSFNKAALVILISIIIAAPAVATNYYVDDDAGSGGSGTIGDPFDEIQDGLNAAYAGDSVIVREGTYTVTDYLFFQRSGTSGSRITLKAYTGETVLVQVQDGRNVQALRTFRDYLTIEGIIFDGNYSSATGLVRFDSGSEQIIVRDCEIRRHGNHMLFLSGYDILIENCHIHHACHPNVQTDAHCICTGRGLRQTFRNCDVHHATGDLWQGEIDSVWGEIVFENCNFHMELADDDCNGISPGTKITENHFDTKDSGTTNFNVTIRYCTICDSRNSRVENGGAMNLKKNVSGFKIYNNKIYNNITAFRLRYPSTDYLIYNNLIFDNDVAFRLEDGISDIDIYNNTLYDNFWLENGINGIPSSLVWKNNIFSTSDSCDWEGTYSYNLFHSVRAGWPSGSGNISGDPKFCEPSMYDLHIQSGSPADEAGTTISEVTKDYDDNTRPQGTYYDIGAFEYVSCGSTPSTPTGLSATAVSSSQIDLSWTDNSSDENGFKIERSEDGENFSQIGGSEANDTDYSDTGLSASTKYYYKVRAYNCCGNSDYSNVDSATTEAIKDVADSDIPVDGTVSGSYTDTHTSNDTYESIEEIESGGKPSNRYTYLEHKWTIDVTGASTVTFYVEAYHTSNSEGDDFIFAYSTDDNSYTNMVTVTKTSDDDTYQSYSLPSSLSGTVYIRVKDADQTAGNRNKDIIYIDHMYIQSGSSKQMIPVETTKPALPNKVRLYSNYPNPFNPCTTIRYSLIKAGHVKLTVYDLIGRIVDVLVDKVQSEGEYTIVWEAVDSKNRALPSGVYLCRLKAGTRVETIKMMYMR